MAYDQIVFIGWVIDTAPELSGTGEAYLGISPPLARLTLPSGTHTITVRNTDFPPYTATLTVSGDNPVTLRHSFGP